MSRSEDKAEAEVLDVETPGPESFRIEPRLRSYEVIGSAVRYLWLPLAFLVFFPGAEDDHVVFLGVNRAQIAIGILLLLSSWIAYRYWRHLQKVLQLGGSLVVIDSEGIFCKERRRLFHWADMFSVNALRSYSLLGELRLNLIYKEPSSEEEKPIYSSYSWRLDGCDVDVARLHGRVCNLHREAKLPEDLYLR